MTFLRFGILDTCYNECDLLCVSTMVIGHTHFDTPAQLVQGQRKCLNVLHGCWCHVTNGIDLL